ncbi:hypothetical protein bcgnr5372_27150 [Bacillus luti]|nr:hypothetical protein [Bacillus cereus]HDR8329715.1 hypothetical protein [Bacillus cereus]HDR8336569.1 hypothetical protein [Bacillus cereus]
MTNKNVLQIICGGLLFLSFFTGWYYYGGFTTIKPMEFINHPDSKFIFKLFLAVPILAIAHIYYGFIKKYNPLLHKISAAVCVILMISMKIYISGIQDNNDSVSTGYYMAGCSVLVSLVSFFIVNKEIKSKGLDSNS